MDEGQNAEILSLLYSHSDESDTETIELIKSRMVVGMERYGHGLRINDDTTEWGTQANSWCEMALEEMLDGLVYTSAAILRLQQSQNRLKHVQVEYLNTMLKDIMRIATSIRLNEKNVHLKEVHNIM